MQNDSAALLKHAEEAYASVVSGLERNEIFIVHLAGGNGLAPVAFTIGGARQSLPDLLIYGLENEMTGPILNSAFEVLKENWPFATRSKFAGVLGDFEVAFRDVSNSDLLKRALFLNAAYNTRNELAQSPILQVCWPDEHGNLPYESTCDANIARAQRVRGLRN